MQHYSTLLDITWQ